jgi:hypothetical protein
MKDGSEHDLQLGACEWAAEANVRSRPEFQVIGRIGSVDVEQVGVAENGSIATGTLWAPRAGRSGTSRLRWCGAFSSSGPLARRSKQSVTI